MVMTIYIVCSLLGNIIIMLGVCCVVSQHDISLSFFRLVMRFVGELSVMKRRFFMSDVASCLLYAVCILHLKTNPRSSRALRLFVNLSCDFCQMLIGGAVTRTYGFI